ncbi:Sodium- and chloride-dependent GABA transporter 2 [Trichoplax sp. H2]|nr:Sodium- and chloride-dependent GABA transporter 2 [Trichoplax sp. H2]|eukprot:RDD42649.1 Sodium- and chloride-dependent GABA transporter 2 [Trichoplax sp. H2]
MVPNEKQENDIEQDKKKVDDEEAQDARGHWDKKIEFLLSCIGYAVGLGNLWRFPYLCYDNGGGAFLIPYTLFLFVCGIPLMALELGIGQYFRQGPTKAFNNIYPLLTGIGVSMIMQMLLFGIYYVVLFSWVFYFLIASFIDPLPWTTCDNAWNTENCLTGNESMPNVSGTSPSEEFFFHGLLEISNHPSNLGPIKWELALLLLISWIVVYFSIFKGIKWSGKVVYFTVTFPYLVLIVLFFRGITLKGTGLGIDFYLRVDLDKLKQSRTWRNAATQIFYSLGTGIGPTITLASYNKRNNNILRDAIIISLTNYATSFFCGFVVFSILGYLSDQGGVPIAQVVTQAGLATLPGANVWSVLFFAMLITLGIDTLMGALETITTGFSDLWPKLLPYRPCTTLGVYIFMFLPGLICVTRGGFYIITLLSWYTADFTAFITAIIELVAVSYCYGGNRFANNISRIINKPVWIPWRISWYIMTPAMIMMIFIFSCIDYKPVTFGYGNLYPWWGEFAGWTMIAICLSGIVIGAIYKIFTTQGTVIERFVKLLFVPKTQEEMESYDLSCDKEIENEEYSLTAQGTYQTAV